MQWRKVKYRGRLNVVTLISLLVALTISSYDLAFLAFSIKKNDNERLPRLTFIVKDKSWGSSIMRGQMVVNALQLKGYDAAYTTIDTFLRADTHLGDICVCVKYCPDIVIRACQRENRAIIWDVLDADVKEYSNRPLNGSVSLFFANSRYHASMLQSELNATAVKVVYHHHTNIFRMTKGWNSSTAPRKLCFTGSPLNTPGKEVLDQLAALAASNNMSFSLISALPDVGPHMPDDPYGQRPVLQRLIDGCDVALIWPAHNDTRVFNYRPITRLVTFWSLGLPTIYYPFAAYLDITSMVSTSLMAFSLEDINRHLHLINQAMSMSISKIRYGVSRDENSGSSENLIIRLIQEQQEAANLFRLDRTIESYEEALKLALVERDRRRSFGRGE
jgi:hypothetical protein